MLSSKNSEFKSLCNGYCKKNQNESKSYSTLKRASLLFVGIALMKCAIVDCSQSRFIVTDKNKKNEKHFVENKFEHLNFDRKLQELNINNNSTAEAVSDQEDHDEHDEDHDEHDEDHDEHDEDHDEHDEDDHDHDEHDHDEHDEDDHDHDEHDHDEHDHDEHGHEDHDEHKHEDKPWGAVIGYSLLINLTSFVGVLAMFTCFKKGVTEKNDMKRKLIDVAVPAFAAGALLATACLLILPEALHQITIGVQEHFDEHNEHDSHDDHDDHDDHDHRRLDDHDDHGHGENNVEGIINAKFGFSIMGGFFLPIVLGAFFAKSSSKISSKPENSPTEVITGVATGEEDDVEKVVEAEAKVVNEVEAEKPVDNQLVASILLGDGFHNLADGIFIGIALMLCSREVAYGIMISTVYHELAQELADFFILTTQAGLSPVKALAYNFLSGLGILLGALITLVNDLEADSIGSILGISAGVYFNIAAAECLPRMEKSIFNAKERLLSLIFFGIGALPIGLVLLNHEHCDDH